MPPPHPARHHGPAGPLRRCSPMNATPRSRPPGVSTSARFQAYRADETGLGRFLMQRLISSLKQTIPNGLEEIQTLARTLTERAADVLAYFDHPRTSNGPTEAINGRLEHLRGIAQGLAQPHQLHHPRPHPRRTPQRPPDNNQLNPTTSPSYRTLKHEEPRSRPRISRCESAPAMGARCSRFRA